MQSKKTFAIRNGYRIPGDPQLIGEELDRISRLNNNELTPEIVVTEAKSEVSPLHECFEWDDTEAARLHRENQARYLVRSVTVRYIRSDNKPMECRAFISTRSQEEGEPQTCAYTPVDELQNSEAKRTQAIGAIKRHIQSLLRTITEFEAYFDDGFTGEIHMKIKELDGCFAGIDNMKQSTGHAVQTSVV